MAKTVAEILSHMEEFIKTQPDTALLAFSGFNGPQYKAAQESTEHWLKLLRTAADTLIDCREAFELWVKSGGDPKWQELTVRDAQGNYTNSVVKGGWFAWLKLWPKASQAVLQSGEIPLLKDIKLLACAVLGVTPDRNTQTAEEVDETEGRIIETARHYLQPDDYPLPKRECSEIPVIDEKMLREKIISAYRCIDPKSDCVASVRVDKIIGVIRPYLHASKRESVDRKEITTLAWYALGYTPDKNTQTPEEVERTLEEVDRIARKYSQVETGNSIEGGGSNG